jgi:hypothetical protein
MARSDRKEREEGAAARTATPAPCHPGKSAFKGLAWDKQEEAWRVRISYNGKQHHIGR